MGLFDTVFFDVPRACSNCGTKIDHVQTKHFDPILREYRVGDIITGSPVLTGVLQEELFCSGCNSFSDKIYFSIWHTVLLGIFNGPREAEERVREVDRAELIDYIDRHQREAETWHGRFSRLYGDLQNLHDYQREPKKKGESRRDIRFFRIRDLLEKEDPLGALIDAHRPVNPEDETELGTE
jgi:hypothetical protein